MRHDLALGSFRNVSFSQNDLRQALENADMPPVPLAHESAREPAPASGGALVKLADNRAALFLGFSIALGGLLGSAKELFQGKNNPAPAPAAVTVQSIPVSDLKLTALKVNNTELSCRYDGKTVTASVNSRDEIVSMICDGRKSSFGAVVPAKEFQSVVRNFSKSLDVLEKSGADLYKTARSFSSPDGVRFNFSAETGGDGQKYVVTPRNLCIILNDTKPGALEEWRDANASLKARVLEIRGQVLEVLGKGGREELERREKFRSFKSRLAAVDASISSRTDTYRFHPHAREYWDQKAREFKELKSKMSLKADTDITSISGAVFNSRYKSSSADLKKIEEELSLKADPVAMLSAEDYLQILERQTRVNNANSRYQAVSSALQESAAHGRLQEFTRGWAAVVDEFKVPAGWYRIDPAVFSHDRHREILGKLDGFLQDYEKELKLAVAADHESISAASAVRERELQDMKTLERAAYSSAGRREIKDLETGMILVEKEDPETERSAVRTYSQDGYHFTEYYSAGYYSRLIKDNGRTGYVSTSFHPSGEKDLVSSWELKEGSRQMVSQSKYHPGGTLVSHSDLQSKSCIFYSSQGEVIFKVSYSDDCRSIRDIKVVGKDGSETGLYPFENTAARPLTKDAYLDILAKKLDTPEKLHHFLMLCMRYTSDGPVDTWQTSSQTLSRVSNAKMLGDCDDYAFLVRDILRRQQIKAHVIYIPSHAVCVWVTKRSDGRYDGHSLCTYGYDKNGDRFSSEPQVQNLKGYETIGQALNSLMRKYRYADLGLREGQDYSINPNNIQVMNVSQHGQKSTFNTTSTYFH